LAERDAEQDDEVHRVNSGEGQAAKNFCSQRKIVSLGAGRGEALPSRQVRGILKQRRRSGGAEGKRRREEEVEGHHKDLKEVTETLQ